MIRIEQLDLDFFGHFTDKKVNFERKGESSSDFHIVYGPNEAGKTTFMEGYLRLLYGFLPRNETYEFHHGRKNLQVSGLLQIDNEKRVFRRTPTKGKSLVDEHGKVLPEASLKAHLGGLTMDDYRNLLCIDDETIDKGGEEIVNSQGDIGTLLFSAAAGISDLWQVLESVSEEAGSIHRKGSTKTRLATLKRRHKEVVKEINEKDIPANKLAKLTKDLEKATKNEATASAAQHELMIDERKLQRVLNALPILERLDLSEAEIQKFDDYPKQLDVSTDQILELEKTRALGINERDRLRKEQLRLQEELKQSAEEPANAALDALIKGLEPSYSLYQHAERELVGRQEALSLTNEKMNRVARDRLQLEHAPESLVVDVATVTSLREARRERDATSSKVQNEKEALEQLAQSIEIVESKLEDLSKDKPEGAGLGDLLDQYNAQALGATFEAAKQSLQEAEDKQTNALQVLSIKGQSFSTLPSCTVMVEEVEAQVERWHRLSDQLEAYKRDEQDKLEELETLKNDIAHFKNYEGLVGDEDTQALKSARDEAWQQHKGSLTQDTAKVFEPKMHEFDKAMEGRLTHTSELVRLREFHRQMPQAEAKVVKAAETIKHANEELHAIEKTLSDVMKDAGIDSSLPPKAVLKWVRDFHDAEEHVHTIERMRIKNQPVFDKADALQTALASHIKREQASLDELLPAANTMLEIYKRYENSLIGCQDELADLLAAQKTATTQLKAYEANQEKAASDWIKQVTISFPVSVDAEKIETSLDALTELRELNTARERLDADVQKMSRDTTAFVEKLNQVMRDHSVTEGETPDSSFNKLKELSAKAQKQVAHRAKLESDLERAFAEEVEAEKRIESVNVGSKVLADLFNANVPTDDLTQLMEAVQKTQEAQNLRKQYEANCSDLRQALGVSSLDSARMQLGLLDAETRNELVAKNSWRRSRVTVRWPN